jgi:hypothetical protein
MLAGGAISWGSNLLLPTVGNSTMEVEYMPAGWAVKELLWLRKLVATLFDMKVAPRIKLMCDNQGALALMCNSTSHQRTKHVDVVHHFLRERVSRGEVHVSFRGTEEMIADTLTQSLPRHELLCPKLRLVRFK